MNKVDLTLDRFKRVFKGQRLIKCKNCGNEWVTKSERYRICCPKCYRYTKKKEAVLIE